MTVRLSGPPPLESAPRVDTELLRRRAGRLLRALGHARSELSITLMGDTEIRSLNARYRGRDRATDVLSFSLLEGEGSQHRGSLLGDVVIGLETAVRQARARHRSLDGELARLVIHGTLHLLGYDHEREEEARVMRAQERRLRRLLEADG